MDREKLIEARSKFMRDNRTLIGNNAPLIADAFNECAEWFMQQPLSERLTDEDKEKIRAIYKRQGVECFQSIETATTRWVLEKIFGADLFK